MGLTVCNEDIAQEASTVLCCRRLGHQNGRDPGQS